jgi:hypothetical protein
MLKPGLDVKTGASIKRCHIHIHDRPRYHGCSKRLLTSRSLVQTQPGELLCFVLHWS